MELFDTNNYHFVTDEPDVLLRIKNPRFDTEITFITSDGATMEVDQLYRIDNMGDLWFVIINNPLLQENINRSIEKKCRGVRHAIRRSTPTVLPAPDGTWRDHRDVRSARRAMNRKPIHESSLKNVTSPLREPPVWAFLNEISQETLWSSHLNRGQIFPVEKICHALGESQTTFVVSDVGSREAAETFLHDCFPGSTSRFRRELGSILSRPAIDDNYFINVFSSNVWPLPEHVTAFDYFHRYVTLLQAVIDSQPWLRTGWPHGRYTLAEVDGNFSGKTIINLKPWDDVDLSEVQSDPFVLRRFVNDLGDFAAILANFRDDINEVMWSTWLALVDHVRFLAEAKPFRSQLYQDVDDALSSYFIHRRVETDELNRDSGELPADNPRVYSQHIRRASPFWRCLETSIARSTPSWVSECSANAQRLAGLVQAAIDDDPFASRFVLAETEDFDVPFVQCTFEAFREALGISADDVDDALFELFNHMMNREFPNGRPFEFNT